MEIHSIFCSLLVGLLACSLETVLAVPQAEATLSHTSGFSLHLSIVNVGDEDLHVLNWMVPVSGTSRGEDLFVVTRVGSDSEVDFLGFNVMRLPAEFPQYYTPVSPGDSIDVTFDISVNYDFTAEGTYEVIYDVFDPNLACNQSGSECLEEIQSDTLVLQVGGVVRDRHRLQYKNNHLQDLSGLLERRLDDDALPADMYDPTCTKAHKDILKKAKAEAIKCLDETCKCLGTVDLEKKKIPKAVKDTFECFFGHLNEDNLKVVKGKYEGIKTDMKQTIKLHCNGPLCAANPGWVAYRDPAKRDYVFLCPHYWGTMIYSKDPKVFKRTKDLKITRKGLLIHEVSHFHWENPPKDGKPQPKGAGTHDKGGYGIKAAKALTGDKKKDGTEKTDANKKADQEKARCSADNYRLFSECLPDAKPQPFAIGDPHFSTWRGDPFDFHGECDLVLLHAPDFGAGAGLDIHIRTKIRYSYSYIESAAIRIGETILEVCGFGQYFLDGVYYGDLRATPPGIKVIYEQMDKKEHHFTIELGQGTTIFVKTYKDIVNVYLDSSTEDLFTLDWATTSTGLMGSFMTGEMLARDGDTTLGDPNEFGQEWMVNKSEPMLFNVPPPQNTTKCVLPPTNLMDIRGRRRLGGGGIPTWQVEKACSHHDGEHAQEACVSDVLATGDLEMATKIDYTY